MPLQSPLPAALTAFTARLLGTVPLILMGVFLFTGSCQWIDLQLDGTALLAWDAALFTAFALPHSLMVRRPFRQRLRSVMRTAYHDAFYAIVSGGLLLFMLVLWQTSEHHLMDLQGGPRWLLHTLALTVAVGFVWALRALGDLDFLGLAALRAHARGGTPPAPRLVIRGPYRWVRHPLYALVLILTWTSPFLPADRLLFNLLCSAWIVAAARWEENDLLTTFGAPYRDYRRRVPMLLPRRPRPDDTGEQPR